MVVPETDGGSCILMSMMFFMRLADQDEINQLLKDPEQIEDWLFEEDCQDLELERAWHGIHFLLTGSKWGGDEPDCLLLAGGEEIGDIDVGYGPARALTIEHVQHLYEVLSKIDRGEVEKRFDSQSFTDNEIYPGGWEDGNDEDSVEFLFSHISSLREFLENGAENSFGAVVWLQ